MNVRTFGKHCLTQNPISMLDPPTTALVPWNKRSSTFNSIMMHGLKRHAHLMSFDGSWKQETLSITLRVTKKKQKKTMMMRVQMSGRTVMMMRTRDCGSYGRDARVTHLSSITANQLGMFSVAANGTMSRLLSKGINKAQNCFKGV